MALVGGGTAKGLLSECVNKRVVVHVMIAIVHSRVSWFVVHYPILFPSPLSPPQKLQMTDREFACMHKHCIQTYAHVHRIMDAGS